MSRVTVSHPMRRRRVPAASTVGSCRASPTTEDPREDHRVGVRVNGDDVGERRHSRQAQRAERSAGRSARCPGRGANTVTLEARGGGADSSLADAMQG